jgi:RNA polymerase primary sigma factor
MRQLKITNSITNRDAQSLDKYLQEINKLELISPEEETQLAILAKQGDKKALDSLIKANLRFVISVAKQYQYQGLSISDLINEGNIGLMKAARNYDASRGFKFISYAVWWIRQHILLAIAENARMVRLPLNKVTLKGRVQKAIIILEQKSERPATNEELAEELNIDIAEITAIDGMNEKHISLDTPLTEDGEDSMLDTLENKNTDSTDNEVNYTGSLKIEIDRSFQLLNERQRETICYFFGIGIEHPVSLEDIAKKFYVTTERARQIKDKVIVILRTSRSFNLLKSYLAA